MTAISIEIALTTKHSLDIELPAGVLPNIYDIITLFNV